MEINAKEARRLAGVDPRTTEEQFLDDIIYYIKLEANRGNRRMVYRIPDKFSVQYLIWRITNQLEFMGFDVNCNYPSYPDIIVTW